jgi:hypothetical protein
MVACFGLHDGWHPSYFPRHLLIEHRAARLDSFQLNRAGWLTEGVEIELMVGPVGHHLAAGRLEIRVDGIPIGLARTDWNLVWFLCPQCSKRRRHIYLPELACRRCLGLDWSSRHRHRSVPNLARLKWLRRRINVSEQPFSPLPERPPHHVRFHRIADEIRTLEAKLVGHLSEINETLERRIRSRKAKGKW